MKKYHSKLRDVLDCINKTKTTTNTKPQYRSSLLTGKDLVFVNELQKKTIK